VHGDDFVFAGPVIELDWVRTMTSECFLTKVVGRLGGGAGEVQELRILNRVVRWAVDGLRYEADPRHAEILVRGMGAIRAASAPGTPSRDMHPPTGDQALSVPEDLARLFRSYELARTTSPWTEQTLHRRPRSSAGGCANRPGLMSVRSDGSQRTWQAPRGLCTSTSGRPQRVSECLRTRTMLAASRPDVAHQVGA
jgi:hypothetical protein